MRRAHGAGAIGLTLLAMVCSACGTTVSGVSSTTAANNELHAPGDGSGPGVGATNGSNSTDGSGATAAGPAAAGGPGAVGSGAASAGAPGSLPPSVADKHAGITSTTITIGVTYYGNASAANQAVGANGITSGNEPADAQAVADDVNRHGGIAGRHVKIELRQVDAQDATPYADQAQADCTYWTQDRHVFAAFVDTAFRGLETACFEKAGTFLFGGDTIAGDDSNHLRFALEPGAMDLTRMAQAEIATFNEADWYGGWDAATATASPTAPVKVGIFTFDSPALRRIVTRYLVPGMRAAGHAPASADIIYAHPPSSEGQDGQLVSELQSAVLRFRQDQVTHVLVTDSAATVTLIFANAAYSQRYFPRLGGSTGNALQALLDGGDIQKQSIQGAVLAGWMPVLDLPHGSAASQSAMNSQARHCMQVMRVTGQSFSDSNSIATAYLYCDALYLLQAALAGTTELTDQSVIAAVDALGSRYQTALAMRTDLASGRHDGSAGFRPEVYDDSCGCMTYRGAEGAV